jgi:hypothetical protein
MLQQSFNIHNKGRMIYLEGVCSIRLFGGLSPAEQMFQLL